MKKLHFEYEMLIEYSVEVSRCNFTIKCFPQDDKRQNIEDVCIDIQPPTSYSWGVDGLGNKQIYGLSGQPHKSFLFRIEGNATTGLEAYEEEENEDNSMIFAHPHGLNRAGKNIKAYHDKLKLGVELNNYEKAEAIMHCLFGDYRYQRNVTNVNTSAEEAFSLGRGVCQDYAHIFIALLHMEHITARYVTGLIIGEGASHAWVEVLYNSRWYGFDPTNNCIVDDNYIKIGNGRDAKDCMINRGIMKGGGYHTQKINVSVKLLSEGNGYMNQTQVIMW